MNTLRSNANILIVVLFIVITGLLVWIIFTGFSQEAIWVAIGIAALSAFFSAVSAVSSWVQADEARKQREMHNKPYIIGYFEGAYGGFLYFVLQNTGNSPAVDLKVNFNPAPVDARGRSLNDVSLYREHISFFPQGKSYRQLVDASFRFLSDKNPTKFRVDFNYETIFREKIQDHIDFDLEYLRDSHLPGPTVEESLSRIADEQKQLINLLKKIIKSDSIIIQTKEEYSRHLEEHFKRFDADQG